ncbi:MAG: HAD family hydrolase [Chloroflexota bacterium]
MIKAILFDLDDTLLGNDMDKFIPPYFDMLGNHVAPRYPKDKFLQALLASTEAMINNQDTAVSNRDAFWSSFAHLTGQGPDALEAYITTFYEDQFPQLQRVSEHRPIAADLVRTCLEQDWQVVIATNPLFPRIAIEQRLVWAGVPVTEFPYALVTAYENMSATKPHPAYYAQILQKLDCAPETAVMVGNDWGNDIEPAASLGLQTYWVTDNTTTPPDPTLVTAYGSLTDLHQRLQTGRLESRQD